MKNGPAAIATILLLMAAGLFAHGLIPDAIGCGPPPTDVDGYWDWPGYGNEPEELVSEAMDLYHRTLVRLITGPRDDRLKAAGEWGGETLALRHGSSDTADPLLMWIDTEPDSWTVRAFLQRASNSLDRSLQPVFNTALDHPDDGVRAAAFRWYGQVRDDQAVRRLERLWPDTPPWSRGLLAKALVRNGSTWHLEDILEQACKEDDRPGQADRQELVEAVLMVDDDAAIPCLFRIVENELSGLWSFTRSKALDALLRWEDRPEVRELLFSLAATAGDPIQYQAVEFLDESGFPGSREKIMELAMEDVQPAPIRIYALDSLGWLNDGDIPMLYEQLRQAKDPRTYYSSKLAADYLIHRGLESRDSIMPYFTGEWTTTMVMNGIVTPVYHLAPGAEEGEGICHNTPWPRDQAPGRTLAEDSPLFLADQFEGNGGHWVAVQIADADCWVRFDTLEPATLER